MPPFHPIIPGYQVRGISRWYHVIPSSCTRYHVVRKCKDRLDIYVNIQTVFIFSGRIIGTRYQVYANLKTWGCVRRLQLVLCPECQARGALGVVLDNLTIDQTTFVSANVLRDGPAPTCERGKRDSRPRSHASDAGTNDLQPAVVYALVTCGYLYAVFHTWDGSDHYLCIIAGTDHTDHRSGSCRFAPSVLVSTGLTRRI